jgi:hypothetical protein
LDNVLKPKVKGALAKKMTKHLIIKRLMIHLAKKFNFEVKALAEPGVVDISLKLVT